MTHPLFTQALAEAYATYSDEFEVYSALEIKVGTNVFRYCSGGVPRQTTLEDGTPAAWTPAPFTVKLPTQSDAGSAILAVNVENVDGTVATIVKLLLAATSPSWLTHRTYLTTFSAPQGIRPIRLGIVSAALTLTGAVFQASIPDFVNRKLPNAFYAYALYPGLRT